MMIRHFHLSGVYVAFVIFYCKITGPHSSKAYALNTMVGLCRSVRLNNLSTADSLIMTILSLLVLWHSQSMFSDMYLTMK